MNYKFSLSLINLFVIYSKLKLIFWYHLSANGYQLVAGSETSENFGATFLYDSVESCSLACVKLGRPCCLLTPIGGVVDMSAVIK
jgi:hypothetical protein